MQSPLTAIRQRRTDPAGVLPPPPLPIKVIARHPIVVHVAAVLGYVVAGIVVTWPHVTYLAGRLPYTRDTASYVWGFWWLEHCVLHLQDPWHTTYLAAPVGTVLGLHALMPLVGVLMLPVTVVFGPSASYLLLSICLPGLLGYAMWRVARLWLPSPVGAVAAGAIFGFAPMVDFQSWVHLNLVAGMLFLPMTLEAAVRLRRHAGPRQAAVLGLVLGASMLVDQESAVLTLIVALAAIVPWLWPERAAAPNLARSWPDRMPWHRIALAALAGLIAVLVAAPQLVAILHANAAGSPPATLSAGAYLQGIRLPDMFLPSPRITSFGLTFAHAHNTGTYAALPTFLALTGLFLGWRQRNVRLLALFWLGAALLAVGADINLPSASYTPVAEALDGQRVSAILPFTWFAELPGLSGFREPSRIAVLGLLPVALLGGYTVNWLRYHARYLLVAVLVLGVFRQPDRAAEGGQDHADAPVGAGCPDRGRSFELHRGGHPVRPARRHRRDRHAVLGPNSGAGNRRRASAG